MARIGLSAAQQKKKISCSSKTLVKATMNSPELHNDLDNNLFQIHASF